MPPFIRVEDRETGAQYDVDQAAFDKGLHKKLNDPDWPDLTADGARPRPAIAVPARAGTSTAGGSSRPRKTAARKATARTSTTTAGTTEAGQPATTTKET